MPKEAPYKQSRAALREIYGSRAIDASAPQSALDQTPSGRMRYLEQQGKTPLQVQEAETTRWRQQFPMQAQQAPMAANRPVADGMPAGWRAARKPEAQLAEPADILAGYGPAGGIARLMATYPQQAQTTLTMPLAPSAPIPASELTAFVPAAPSAPSVPWRRTPKPAYMSGLFSGAQR